MTRIEEEFYRAESAAWSAYRVAYDWLRSAYEQSVESDAELAQLNKHIEELQQQLRVHCVDRWHSAAHGGACSMRTTHSSTAIGYCENCWCRW